MTSKKRQPNVVLPLPGFIILKDFIDRVLPAGKYDFWMASSPLKGVNILRFLKMSLAFKAPPERL